MARTVTRPPAGAPLRSAALGLAAGGRTSLGMAAPVLSWRTSRAGECRSRLHTATRVMSIIGVALELAGDKLPQAPSRLDRRGVAARVVSAVSGSAVLCRRDHVAPGLPLLAAALGALTGAYGGAAWRAWAADRMPAWQGALVEDVVVLGLAGSAVSGGE
ncbi:MAG: hypothetical protein K0Q93_2056 [Nocardioidaceae bacterium]|nr:hypothetical protein [Nocardioidaceae bacterium]